MCMSPSLCDKILGSLVNLFINSKNISSLNYSLVSLTLAFVRFKIGASFRSFL